MSRWSGGVTALIGVSRYVLGVHQALFPTANKRVVRPPLKSSEGAPARALNTPPTTFGFMGSLTPAKGVALLLEAAPSLAREGLTLRVAGDGPLRHEIAESEHVRYEGYLQGSDLTAFMGSCDVGLVPSLWDEPGPFVVPEWLGMGRPVLATRRGGLAEAERHGGVLTFGQSSTALEQAILSVRDPGEWRRLLASLPTVDGDTDVQRWLDEHESAYESALGHAGASSDPVGRGSPP
jgi:glycosyltransferase involved in cell wall biosynthesis